MSRSGLFKVRIISGDVKYNDKLVQKIINCVMTSGKKAIAARIVYDALAILEEKYTIKGNALLNEIIVKISPDMFLRKKKIASKNYNIPVSVSEEMRHKIGCKWFVAAIQSDARKEKNIVDRFVNEAIAIKGGQGVSMKRKEQYHKVAKDNEVFMHYG